MKKVVCLTGAGISAESGIPTFRDIDGLWEKHKVEDVASPEGWMTDPKLVWRFYQQRRRDMAGIRPNKAHYDLVALEQKLNAAGDQFTIITQNVDGLHLKAGSQNVIEMHGALRRLRCQKCQHTVIDETQHLSDDFLPCVQCGWQMMRPDIVWFGEFPQQVERYVAAIDEMTHFIVIGTSGEVMPAAGFLFAALKRGLPTFYQNTEEAQFREPPHMKSYIGKATEQVELICKDLI